MEERGKRRGRMRGGLEACATGESRRLWEEKIGDDRKIQNVLYLCMKLTNFIY